ncbi:hypothetical protein CUJ87_09140 [Paraburkholderia caledonica]|nr:hypothetical protein CUJ87_09140 [Paraburkholderia caledonica]
MERATSMQPACSGLHRLAPACTGLHQLVSGRLRMSLASSLATRAPFTLATLAAGALSGSLIAPFKPILREPVV